MTCRYAAVDGSVGGWVFFLGEEDAWIRGTLVAGLGGGGLCRSSAVWDGMRLLGPPSP